MNVIEGQVAYTFTSDKNQKENIQSVNGEAVLTKLAKLPVSTWNYIGQDAKQSRHYGPMAQEFFAAFGRDRLGTIGTDTTINSGDIEGVLLIGVQALQNHIRKLQQENTNLQTKIRKLNHDNLALRASIGRVRTEQVQSLRETQELRRQIKAISGRLDAAATLVRLQP